MTLAISVPGVDASASGLPARSDRLAGFPTNNLFGLWLCEDGATGVTPSAILDSSGNNHNGTLFTSGSFSKSAEGYATGATLGFLFDTGFPFASNFTAIGITRNRVAGGNASSTAYPVLLTTTGSCASSSMTGSIGATGASTRGALLVNHDSFSADSGASAGAEIGLFQYIAGGTSSQGWGGGSNASRRICRNTTQPKSSWIAWALSVNHDTGTVIFKAQGISYTLSVATDLANFTAGAGNVVLGMSHWQLATICQGDIGLAALYSYAAAEADMDKLIAAAKKRMALAAHNGVTVL